MELIVLGIVEYSAPGRLVPIAQDIVKDFPPGGFYRLRLLLQGRPLRNRADPLLQVHCGHARGSPSARSARSRGELREAQVQGLGFGFLWSRMRSTRKFSKGDYQKTCFSPSHPPIALVHPSKKLKKKKQGKHWKTSKKTQKKSREQTKNKRKERKAGNKKNKERREHKKEKQKTSRRKTKGNERPKTGKKGARDLSWQGEVQRRGQKTKEKRKNNEKT